MDKDESKSTIVEKCSSKDNESECVHKHLNKQKVAKNKSEYEESSDTNEVSKYFNIFECGKNLINRLDMTYEQTCMAT